MTEPAPAASRWAKAAALYADRRLLVVLAMGFSSGLPLALTAGTLAIWLRRSGVDKTTIGLFALVGLPYVLKFLWAPLIDRMRLPFLTARLGRRRGWAAATQLALMAAILALGMSDPAADPTRIAFLALVVAFCSASQDIVIDAYRIDILRSVEQGAGAAMTQAGYRLGLLASGAGALYLAEFADWRTAYAAMAALVGLGLATVLLAREPAATPGAAERQIQSDNSARWLLWLKESVIDPFSEFAGRSGAIWALLLIVLYKLGDAFSGTMANPFYVDLGFTNSEIASVSKVMGLIATVLGIFAGGVLVARWGVMRALVSCGLLQMTANLMFALQAAAGHDIRVLMATVFSENFVGGLGSAAFVAYLSVLCHARFSATQYALLSSFMAIGRTTLAASSGWFADHLNWIQFFILAAVLALPGLAMLLWVRKKFPHSVGSGVRPGVAGDE